MPDKIKYERSYIVQGAKVVVSETGTVTATFEGPEAHRLGHKFYELLGLLRD